MISICGSKSNKSTRYHKEMNWDAFSDWCETRFFASIAASDMKSVVVLGRVIYRTIFGEGDKRIATW